MNYCKELGLDVTKSQDIAPNVPEALQRAIQAGFDKANKKAVSNASKVKNVKFVFKFIFKFFYFMNPTFKVFVY